MSLKSIDSKVSELLINAVYSVPLNQRKYVWNENNWRELLDDIDLVHNKVIAQHFVGSIVLNSETVEDGIMNHFKIIDGQQRLLTLSMLIASIGFLFARNNRFDSLRGLSKYLVVTDNQGKDHPIVSEKANLCVAEFVSVLLLKAQQSQETGDTMPSLDYLLRQAKADKKISKCIMFFVAELETRASTNIELLGDYLNHIYNIRYINIVADTDEDAYSIFEVLNARGQILTDYDLLRNFILKYSTGDKHIVSEKLDEISDMLGNDIENFIKHYVWHKYGTRTDNKDKRPYKVIVSKQEKSDMHTFLEDLQKKANYYRIITTGESCSSIEKRIFLFLKNHRSSQYRPLFLSLLHMKDNGVLSNEEYIHIVIYLYRFYICFKIIGELASNKIDDIVDNYATKFENDFNGALVDEMKNSLRRRLPDETNFRNSFRSIKYSNAHKAFSGSRMKANVTAILEYYEGILGYEGEIDIDQLTIEHCNPDSESAANAIIGNLILLESEINGRVRNKPLSEKISDYRNSLLLEPKEIIELTESSNFNPIDRMDDMANKIYSSIINM